MQSVMDLDLYQIDMNFSSIDLQDGIYNMNDSNYQNYFKMEPKILKLHFDIKKLKPQRRRVH